MMRGFDRKQTRCGTSAYRPHDGSVDERSILFELDRMLSAGLRPSECGLARRRFALSKPTAYAIGMIGEVASFDALLNAPWCDGVSALTWRRSLAGDFDAVAAAVGPIDEIISLDAESLLGLSLTPAGALAREQLLADLQMLRAAGLDPSLDVIPLQARAISDAPVVTDVYSWHADSATDETDTWLCSYNVAATETLPTASARRHVDMPEIRAKLLQLYGGDDGEGFRDYLREHYYDLHYVAVSGARPISFGLGHLWRIATLWPGCPVPPCVHRAPQTVPGSVPRLLLIC